MTHWRAARVKHTIPQRMGEGHGNTPCRAAHPCEHEWLNSLAACVPDGGQVSHKPANSFSSIESYIIAMHDTDPRLQDGEPCF